MIGAIVYLVLVAVIFVGLMRISHTKWFIDTLCFGIPNDEEDIKMLGLLFFVIAMIWPAALFVSTLWFLGIRIVKWTYRLTKPKERV